MEKQKEVETITADKKKTDNKELFAWELNHHCEKPDCVAIYRLKHQNAIWQTMHIPRTMTVEQFKAAIMKQPKVKKMCTLEHGMKLFLILCDASFRHLHVHFEAPPWLYVYDVVSMLQVMHHGYHMGIGKTPQDIKFSDDGSQTDLTFKIPQPSEEEEKEDEIRQEERKETNEQRERREIEELGFR